MTGQDAGAAATGPTPNYWCTWTTQGRMLKTYQKTGEIKFAGDQGIVGIRDNLNEQVLFREGAGWARVMYPESRGDLNLLLDDGWDVGYGHDSGQDHGSLILNAERFPSYDGAPAERLKKMASAVKGLGWRGLGLWVAPQMPGERWNARKPDAMVYADLREKIGWCGEAGVAYLKVDWGARCHDLEYRRKMSEFARELAPGTLVEHCYVWSIPLNGVRVTTQGGAKVVEPGSGRWDGDEDFEQSIAPLAAEMLKFSDVLRVYDLVSFLFAVQALERAQTLMRLAEKVGGGAYVNVEDVPYLAATLGATMGVMRAPIWPEKPGAVVNFALRTGEATRAVAWQRLAPPFRARTDYPTRSSDATLTDVWTFRPGDTWYKGVEGKAIPQTAPAATTRGLDAFPTVEDAGEGLPFVTAMRHPNGALAIGALPRVDDEHGYRTPAARVRLNADASGAPVGAFGRFNALTLRASRRPGAVLMSDLAGGAAHDVTAACQIEDAGGDYRVTIPGALLEKIGREALHDQSDPGALIRL